MKANPLAIVPILLRAVRPSRTADMPAVANGFWLGKGYAALTFFGTIITHSEQEAQRINRRFDALKNHEMIHLRQAQSTHDSWIVFYWKYLVFWLKGCRYRKRLKNAGYLLNPFEMEAYANMYDLDYLKHKENGTNEWRRYAAMSLEERLKLYKSKH
ncbi:MAG: hypothetical protein IJ710_06370 [Prevotella sp.]|nr:hypothetical protein [Prevotella sp.]